MVSKRQIVLLLLKQSCIQPPLVAAAQQGAYPSGYTAILMLVLDHNADNYLAAKASRISAAGNKKRRCFTACHEQKLMFAGMQM